MNYIGLQERLSNLLAGNARSRQTTEPGTPATLPDGVRRQDAGSVETLVGGSDKRVDTAAPTHGAPQ